MRKIAIKLLIGGSPCTHWSIAQKNNRETVPSGEGWELFKNYLIAKEKFKPDFFLYENNKSAAQAIKDQIAKELGVGVDPKVRFTYINSALVSAQNRQRFYVTNFGDIEQPEDRGILLKDILEYGIPFRKDKSHCIDANYFKGGNLTGFNRQSGQRLCVAEPVGDTNGAMVAEPLCVAQRGRYGGDGSIEQQYEARTDGKTNAITTVQKDNSVAEPVCMRYERGVPVKAVSCADGKEYPVYQVLNGQITIKDKQYDIKLPDGYYIIRKLTVTECCRLQTMPDDYCKAVSATQAYKGLGNGWTAEVIIHLLNHALKDIPRNEEIVVLSLYDGIGTGRYCLDKMGFTNVKYYAYEIDKYPMAIANDNYPDIIQCGDAFAVREDSWKPPLGVSK